MPSSGAMGTRQSIKKLTRPVRPSQSVIRQVGVGRNPTVIVFHAIEPMIMSDEVDMPATLGMTLENAKSEERRVGGARSGLYQAGGATVCIA